MINKLLIWLARKTNKNMDTAMGMEQVLVVAQHIVDTVTLITSYAGRDVNEWDLKTFVDFTRALQQIGEIERGVSNGNNID